MAGRFLLRLSRRLGWAVFTLLLAAPSSGAAEPGFVVLVPARWRVSASVDRATLRRLFLGRRSEIGGEKVLCLAMPPGSAVRDEFNRVVLGMTEDQLTAYWIDQALLGGALPPEEVEDVEALAERLRAGRLAIGYAARARVGDAPPSGLKVLPFDG